MSNYVLRCGDDPIPLALTSLEISNASAVPTPAEIDDLLSVAELDDRARIIVLGDDRALAAVLTRLLRKQLLAIEVAFVPTEKSAAAKIYGLDTGAAAAKTALNGKAKELPLIRDEHGTALVGIAKIYGAHGDPLTGEAYVDDTAILNGATSALFIEPMAEMPGVRGRTERGLRLRRRWRAGRAVQLGTTGAIVIRDGVNNQTIVPRVTFYRYEEPWRLVC